MSDENNAKSPAGGILETLKSNPKAMYAAGGAVVVVILALLMGGGGGDETKPYQTAVVSAGQTVTIQSPNIGNTILVNAPGKLGSVDDDDDTVICRNVVAGTTATVEEEQTVNYISFVRVTVKDGECAGKSGWMPKVNIRS